MCEREKQLKEEFQKRALTEAGISYSLCALLPLVFTLLLSLVLIALSAGKEENWYLQADWYKYLCYLIPQLCFALSAVVYFKRSKTPVKSLARGAKWYYFVAALLLQFGLTFSLSALNGYFVELLKLLGYEEQSSTLPALYGGRVVPAILVIALLPALFEEVVFRGIMVRQMKENGWGFWATLLISGALFSLFHHNPEQTVYQFICGVCFALVALRSGSVLPTMTAHFFNNAVILILSAIVSPSGENWSLSGVMSTGGYIALIVVSALCLVAALVFFLFGGRLLHLSEEEGEKGWKVKCGKAFFLAAAAGMGLCLVEWVATLIGGLA